MYDPEIAFLCEKYANDFKNSMQAIIDEVKEHDPNNLLMVEICEGFIQCMNELEAVRQERDACFDEHERERLDKILADGTNKVIQAAHAMMQKSEHNS
jgi:hypothetical protein